MGKLFTDEEYQIRVNAVTIEDAIDYAIHDTIGNTIDGKGEYKEIPHPISMATANYLNLLKDLQDNYNIYMADCKVIEALVKQIPKKPVKSGVTDSKGVFHPINGIDGVPYDLCPNCETNLCTTGMLARNKTKYCQECGQKLDWH